MRNSLAILVAFAVVSAGFAVSNTYAASNGSAEKNSTGSFFARSYDVSKLIGMKVNNEQGENLGKIEDFVADSQGRIAFAILSYGGVLGMGETLVAVPFESLSYDSPGRLFVLNTSKEKLASAPKYEGMSGLANPKLAEDIYRFFGQHPYWTEENVGMPDREGRENP
ncbi:MAG TPA: PRC-barrel domain-containing protein [Thermodesulfobacteriota bacterium]|nr:PRC-barrel domain-containing protein [Thermodesulfobacteriota bacterium]